MNTAYFLLPSIPWKKVCSWVKTTTSYFKALYCVLWSNDNS